MRARSRKLAAALWSLLPILALAAAPVQTIHLTQDGYDLRLESDASRGQIRLYSLGSPEPLPGELGVTITQSDGVVREVKLQELKPPVPGPARQAFSGSLDLAQAPVTGLELRIGLSAGGLLKRLHWNRRK
jgi:hypothetical protein